MQLGFNLGLCYHSVNMDTENRWKDWLEQAKDDLIWAQSSYQSGFYAQTCFICQQTADKALKALAYRCDAVTVKSYSAVKLSQELSINGEILAAAKKLDGSYISGRYPDAFSSGRPTEFIQKDDAELALNYVNLVVAKMESSLA
jgi:HEPN domain-containing protein